MLLASHEIQHHDVADGPDIFQPETNLTLLGNSNEESMLNESIPDDTMDHGYDDNFLQDQGIYPSPNQSIIAGDTSMHDFSHDVDDDQPLAVVIDTRYFNKTVVLPVNDDDSGVHINEDQPIPHGFFSKD